MDKRQIVIKYGSSVNKKEVAQILAYHITRGDPEAYLRKIVEKEREGAK